MAGRPALSFTVTTAIIVSCRSTCFAARVAGVVFAPGQRGGGPSRLGGAQAVGPTPPPSLAAGEDHGSGGCGVLPLAHVALVRAKQGSLPRRTGPECAGAGTGPTAHRAIGTGVPANPGAATALGRSPLGRRHLGSGAAGETAALQRLSVSENFRPGVPRLGPWLKGRERCPRHADQPRG